MSIISRITSLARSAIRRGLGSGASTLSTILLMAFAIGAVAGVSSGGGQGNFASALLSGGLVKSAHASDKSTARPGAGPLAKAEDAERIAPQWRVISVRGKSEVREGGDMLRRWSDAEPGLLLNKRTLVRTGPDAEVIISNGHDTLTLAPDSVLELPTPGANPGLTQVVQKRGTINYDIESRILPGTKEDRPSVRNVLFSTQRLRGRFEVVTPFLIVGVKGTNFNVDVDSRGTSVDVSEGIVEVETPDGEDSATVVAGQSANVATQSGSAVSVTTTTTASAAPAVSPVGPTAVATSDDDDDSDKNRGNKNHGDKNNGDKDDGVSKTSSSSGGSDGDDDGGGSSGGGGDDGDGGVSVASSSGSGGGGGSSGGDDGDGGVSVASSSGSGGGGGGGPSVASSSGSGGGGGGGPSVASSSGGGGGKGSGGNGGGKGGGGNGDAGKSGH